MSPINVAVVDDQPLVASAFEMLLAVEADLRVFPGGRTGRDAVRLCRSEPVDVLLMERRPDSLILRLATLAGMGDTYSRIRLDLVVNLLVMRAKLVGELQVFGGAGYLRGAKVERIYRETKVMSIGGGSVEIMKDLAARQMGL